MTNSPYSNLPGQRLDLPDPTVTARGRGTTGMDYKIIGTTLQAVIMELDPGETVFSESGGMAWMSNNIVMQTGGRGGGLGGVLKRAVSGESLFLVEYTSQGGRGTVAFASDFPGKIVALHLSEGQQMIAQKEAFLCAEKTVGLDIHFRRRLGAGLFGGEGFILQKLTGPGVAFVCLDGEIMEYTLAPNETLKVDTGSPMTTPSLPDAITPPAFSVPARHNPKLQTLVERINADEELWQLWRCANVNAMDRLAMSDHGEVHIRIVANAALKLLRLLVDAGHTPGVVTGHGLTPEDAEVVVVLAAALHDLGISIHRDNHEEFSLALANLKAKELLAGLYPVQERTIIVSEVLHAIIAHHGEVRCLTLEAGALKVADALDMTAGRSRIPFEAGSSSIHAVSAAAIDEVAIKKGENKPARVEIRMSNSAGIFQVDELLRRKLRHSTLAGLVEVVARIEGESEKRLLPLYSLEGA